MQAGDTIIKNGETFTIQQEFTFGHSLQPKSDGKAYLTIRKRIFYIKPKIKFVRSRDKTVVLEQKDVATYEITTRYKIVKEKRSRSWLGNGIQTDDINCYSEWEEDVFEFEQPDLDEFIKEKLVYHILSPL